VGDEARFRDGGRDVADAAHDSVCSNLGPQEFVLLHAVLKRDDGGAASRNGLQRSRDLLGIPERHADDDEVDRLHLRDVVDGLDHGEAESSERW